MASLLTSGGLMAKRTAAAVEHGIDRFAEDLGKMLGHARTKAEGWLGQRQDIVKTLTELRDEASKLLSQLGHDVPFTRHRRRGRPASSTTMHGEGRPSAAMADNSGKSRKRRSKMSAAARKGISARMKKYWAARRAAKAHAKK